MSATRDQKMLTEPEAWRKIARRLDTLRDVEGYLCDEVWFESTLTVEVRASMLARIRQHMEPGAFSAYPDDMRFLAPDVRLNEFRKARVLAALFLALEAEDDADAATLPSETAQQHGRAR